MNTRDIADKLWAYADLLEAEKSRLSFMYRLMHTDHVAEILGRIESDLEDVRGMANELWDKKESI